MDAPNLRENFKNFKPNMSEAEFSVFMIYDISQEFGLKTLDKISSVTHDLFKTKENVFKFYESIPR